MAIRINPFHELYVGESIGPDKFVDLFSSVIVEHAYSLFQPGHVILKGLPGAGKSMLLNLLKPSIRIAYAQSNESFPVPPELRKFIGAGINLKRSGISDFGQRPIDNAENHLQSSPIYFADFLNYWVVSDIIASIEKLHNSNVSESLSKEIGIDLNNDKLSLFVQDFSKADCWLGYFDQVRSFNDFKQSINKRITNYRSYLNFNTNSIDERIKQTKSLIGIPVSKCVELLKEHEIISNSTEVFIRIDQYEELAWLDGDAQGIGNNYQEIIHKLLGLRDINVSYRIGTRHFAWSGEKKMFGSTARLERKRNYTEISIDDVLKRKENQRTWIFPKFAEDIFSRRIKLSPYSGQSQESSLLTQVFGKGFSPNERALNYLPSGKDKAIRFDDNWPEPWKLYLMELAQENPLNARLAEAWARQKGKEKIIHEIPIGEQPWEVKKWWKKERIEQALMQIASRNQQQLMWQGKDDILGLSGGNILIFLSLCQHIWDVWIRDNRNSNDIEPNDLPFIDSVIQSVGIRETSKDWFEDITNEKGGKERKVFVNYLGSLFYKSLVEDKAMSYPGWNGFSLTVEELEKNFSIKSFLDESCDYGDLYDYPHTSKLQDKKPRIKYYLNPILSPYFKIPYAHTKEPMYIDTRTVSIWLVESGAMDIEVEDIAPKKKRALKKATRDQGSIKFPNN